MVPKKQNETKTTWTQFFNARFTKAQLQDDQKDPLLKNKVAEKVNWARCAYTQRLTFKNSPIHWSSDNFLWKVFEKTLQTESEASEWLGLYHSYNAREPREREWFPFRILDRIGEYCNYKSSSGSRVVSLGGYFIQGGNNLSLKLVLKERYFLIEGVLAIKWILHTLP